MAQRRVRAHVNPLSILKEYEFEGFENDHPIIIDVGACKGEFSFALAEKIPEKNFILFEIRVPLARKLEAMFQNFPNVRVFDGDAGRNFQSIITPSVNRGINIETIYVNFPDPWFKAKHKKRRFINPTFLKKAATFLPASTEFVFQTDQQFLFQETKELLLDSPYNQISEFENPPYGIRTDWEAAKVAAQCPIWRMRFSRTE